MDNQTAKSDQLKIKSVRGSLALLTAQFVKFGLQIAVTILLSRLILPEDFGVFAIIFAVTGFIAIFKDGGLTLSTVQTQTLSEKQLNTLFWLNSLLGLGLTMVTILAAWMTSLIYSDLRLFQIGSGLAVTFLFIGLAAQHRALLRRQMDFTKLAVIEVLAIFLAGISGISAAFYGFGFWSLVIFNVVLELVGMVLVWLKSSWQPRFQFDWKESRSLVTFGGYLTVFEFIGYLNFSFDNLLIGWFWGNTMLGFYDKAFQLLLIPFNQLTLPLGRVVHSTLSRLQTEPERYREYFYRYALLFTSIGMPLVALIFGTADLIIPFLLGENWLPSVAIFKALAPAAFCMTISPCVGWLYISLGRVKRQLYWHSGMVIIWLIVLVIALQNSVLTVAIAFSIMRVLSLIPTLAFASYNSPISWKQILRTLFMPMLASLGALAILLEGQFYLPSVNGQFWQIMRDVFIYGVAYFGIWVLIPNGRKLLADNFRLVKSAFKIT